MTGLDVLDADAWAALAAIAIAVCLYMVRRDRHRASKRRVERLERAAKLLHEHATALREFLGHADAPAELKAVLIGFSDAMEDERVATSIAELVARPQNVPPGPEAQAVFEAIEGLRKSHPDLANWFVRAIGTATVAGLLRWEGTARLFEPVMATIVADPRRECAAAVEGAKRSGISGWLPPVASPAAA